MIRIFGHFISLRAILIATFELAAILAIYDLATIITMAVALGDSSQGIAYKNVFELSFSFLLWLTAASCGMYSAETISDPRSLIGRLITVAVVANFSMAVIVSLLELMLTESVNMKLFYAINLSAAACYSLVAALFRMNVFSRKLNGTILEHRVVVLGANELAGKIARQETTSSTPFTVTSFVPIEGEEISPSVAQSHIAKAVVLDEPQGLLEMARQEKANEVVFASRERRGMPINALMQCKMGGLVVSNFSDFWERHTGQVDLDALNPGWMIFSSGFRISWQGAILKRAFDLIIGSALLVLTFPICILAAIAVKLDSSGPIFYSQERIGQMGQRFRIYKFRSMTQDAERDGKAIWAQKNDTRVTRVGKFLRLTRIDEIPQVVNVLAGEMSFVGPRPERPQFVEKLADAIPFYDVRHQLKPGITGWAQVNLPYGASDDDAKAKLAYDLYYVKNWNLFLDIVILVQTVQVVLWRLGAR